VNDLSFTFLGWTALLAGVWFLFDKSESVASQDTKLRITRWLKGLDLDATASTWPATFITLFDGVFGKRHLSWLCFLRSCVASSSVVGIALLVWAAFNWNRIAIKYGTSGLVTFVALVVLTTCVSLVPDYVSLLKTRCIIQQMRGIGSYPWIATLLALDLFTTGCLALGAYAGVLLGFEALSKATGNQPAPVSLLPVLVGSIRTGNFGYIIPLPPGYQGVTRIEDGVPFAIWFFAAFFTSMWAALYALSVTAVRIAHAFGVGISAFRDFFDIEKKPLTSLGFVATLLVSIGFWTVAIVHRH